MRGALERDLQAARYAAQRAQRQYDAADPENRLVADELERRWNQALERVRELEQRIDQQAGAGETAPPPTVEEFATLAEQLEALWHSETADARLKKRIVRSLIHEVVVDVDSAASEVVLVIHWQGGLHTEVRVPRRRRGQNSTHTAKETLDAVRALARICSDTLIANVLTATAGARGAATSGPASALPRCAVTMASPSTVLNDGPTRAGLTSRKRPAGSASTPARCDLLSSVASSPPSIPCRTAPGSSIAIPSSLSA